MFHWSIYWTSMPRVFRVYLLTFSNFSYTPVHRTASFETSTSLISITHSIRTSVFNTSTITTRDLVSSFVPFHRLYRRFYISLTPKDVSLPHPAKMVYFLDLLYSQLLVKIPEQTSDFSNQTVIVTGSNTGLGLEAARLLLRLKRPLSSLTHFF